MYKLLGLSPPQFKKRTYLLLGMVLPSSETERQCTPEGLSRQALYIVLAVPELTMQIRLALNSQKMLSLLSTRIKGVCHHYLSSDSTCPLSTQHIPIYYTKHFKSFRLPSVVQTFNNILLLAPPETEDQRDNLVQFQSFRVKISIYTYPSTGHAIPNCILLALWPLFYCPFTRLVWKSTDIREPVFSSL